MLRCSWTHTAKGNWICQSGSYVAVAEWQGAGWELRIKTGHDTVSSTTINATSPADLEIAMQRMIQKIARQSAEVRLLEYEPFNALPQ
jgi:hypothetical protein